MKVVRRWHRWHVGRLQIDWYLGDNSHKHWWMCRYGFRLNRRRLCCGPLYVSLWTRTKAGRFREGWGPR